MTLEKLIRSAVLGRHHAMPLGGRNYVLVCYRKELPHLGQVVGRHNHGSFSRIALLDHAGDAPKALALDLGDGQQAHIPITGMQGLEDLLHCEFILFSHDYDYALFLWGQRALLSLGFSSFNVVMPYLHDSGFKTAHRPDFWSRHRRELEEVCGLLADDESRKVLASRIRALVTGNVGYLRLSEYPQYFHPLVQPRPGDVVMDGGVSEYVEEQARISAAVGQAGRVIGFEPNPEGFQLARQRLAEYPACANYTLLPCGLWNRKEMVRFNTAGVGSHVSGDDGGIEAPMTTVDEVVREMGLPRVDFVKLDVEGAEANALRGALASLVRFHPRMAVSAYHRLEDLFELPRMVRQILPDARLYLGHHHPALFDTVLYVDPT